MFDPRNIYFSFFFLLFIFSYFIYFFMSLIIYLIIFRFISRYNIRIKNSLFNFFPLFFFYKKLVWIRKKKKIRKNIMILFMVIG